ncbi:MAG: hypothetical protein LBJ92_03165 [Holosporales bacterium]|jgi:hypothetical protein|nr:hypothetical protein [Holosporales bacterium]
MEGEPAHRTGVYFGVHQGDVRRYLSTGSTQQKTDYGEFGKRAIENKQKVSHRL